MSWDAKVKAAGLPGGIRLTVQGEAFGSSRDLVTVLVSNQACTVTSVQPSQLTCTSAPLSAAGAVTVQVSCMAWWCRWDRGHNSKFPLTWEQLHYTADARFSLSCLFQLGRAWHGRPCIVLP